MVAPDITSHDLQQFSEEYLPVDEFAEIINRANQKLKNILEEKGCSDLSNRIYIIPEDKIEQIKSLSEQMDAKNQILKMYIEALTSEIIPDIFADIKQDLVNSYLQYARTQRKFVDTVLLNKKPNMSPFEQAIQGFHILFGNLKSILEGLQTILESLPKNVQDKLNTLDGVKELFQTLRAQKQQLKLIRNDLLEQLEQLQKLERVLPTIEKNHLKLIREIFTDLLNDIEQLHKTINTEIDEQIKQIDKITAASNSYGIYQAKVFLVLEDSLEKLKRVENLLRNYGVFNNVFTRRVVESLYIALLYYKILSSPPSVIPANRIYDILSKSKTQLDRFIERFHKFTNLPNKPLAQNAVNLIVKIWAVKRYLSSLAEHIKVDAITDLYNLLRRYENILTALYKHISIAKKDIQLVRSFYNGIKNGFDSAEEFQAYFKSLIDKYDLRLSDVNELISGVMLTDTNIVESISVFILDKLAVVRSLLSVLQAVKNLYDVLYSFRSQGTRLPIIVLFALRAFAHFKTSFDENKDYLLTIEKVFKHFRIFDDYLNEFYSGFMLIVDNPINFQAFRNTISVYHRFNYYDRDRLVEHFQTIKTIQKQFLNDEEKLKTFFNDAINLKRSLVQVKQDISRAADLKSLLPTVQEINQLRTNITSARTKIKSILTNIKELLEDFNTTCRACSVNHAAKIFYYTLLDVKHHIEHFEDFYLLFQFRDVNRMINAIRETHNIDCLQQLASFNIVDYLNLHYSFNDLVSHKIPYVTDILELYVKVIDLADSLKKNNPSGQINAIAKTLNKLATLEELSEDKEALDSLMELLRQTLTHLKYTGKLTYKYYPTVLNQYLLAVDVNKSVSFMHDFYSRLAIDKNSKLSCSNDSELFNYAFANLALKDITPQLSYVYIEDNLIPLFIWNSLIASETNEYYKTIKDELIRDYNLLAEWTYLSEQNLKEILDSQLNSLLKMIDKFIKAPLEDIYTSNDFNGKYDLLKSLNLKRIVNSIGAVEQSINQWFSVNKELISVPPVELPENYKDLYGNDEREYNFVKLIQALSEFQDSIASIKDLLFELYDLRAEISAFNQHFNLDELTKTVNIVLEESSYLAALHAYLSVEYYEVEPYLRELTMHNVSEYRALLSAAADLLKILVG